MKSIGIKGNQLWQDFLHDFAVSTGSALMVESPTYYHSLSPVLRSLKEFDMEDFPLQEEVIYARAAREIPDYLRGATFQTAIVCSSKNTRKTGRGSQEKKPEDEKHSSNCQEISDEVALKEAMDTQSVDWSGGHDLGKEVYLESLSGSTSSSISLKEFVELRDSPRVKTRNLDDMLVFLPSMCGIDPSEVEGALAKSTPEEQIDTNHISENIEPNHRATEELGGRMNVERFLEIFSSSSESSLEASQCDALVHALKNRLAVIQG